MLSFIHKKKAGWVINMKTKINWITVFLIGTTVILGGLSVYIASKLIEEKPATVPTKIKAAEKTYHRFFALNQTNPTLTPTEMVSSPLLMLTPTPLLSPSPTTTVISPTNDASPTNLSFNQTINPSESPTPTQIQLVTTPIITDSAYDNLTPTETEATLAAAISPTQKQVIKSLPQSGIYMLPFLIILAALVLIFFSFII
jgi:hypothetical protein